MTCPLVAILAMWLARWVVVKPGTMEMEMDTEMETEIERLVCVKMSANKPPPRCLSTGLDSWT